MQKIGFVLVSTVATVDFFFQITTITRDIPVEKSVAFASGRSLITNHAGIVKPPRAAAYAAAAVVVGCCSRNFKYKSFEIFV